MSNFTPGELRTEDRGDGWRVYVTIYNDCPDVDWSEREMCVFTPEITSYSVRDARKSFKALSECFAYVARMESA